jgi:class 3 adenylate cyclase
VQATLRDVQHRHDLATPVYTLRPTADGRTSFVVMTNAVPFIGDHYITRDEMRPVLAGAPTAGTGLYEDEHGAWISGYAPVVLPDGRVDALVSVDARAEALGARRARARMLVVFAALLGGLAGGLATRERGAVRRLMDRLTGGSLAVRIGLTAGVAVAIAVAVVAALDHRAARQELIHHHQERLRTAVRLGAHSIDVGLHQEVGRTGDAEAAAFLALREQLRTVQTDAGLSSPVYTLRRDGAGTRFVGMTNEVPFVGDPYELRPGVAATLDGAGVGGEGPYHDAHGTWISAWAPLLDEQGHIVGVLQADQDVAAAMMTLWNRTLLRLLFALVGALGAFGVAVVLARSIARPVRQVAVAARKVGAGEYDIAVPTHRRDEVGELARAVDQMARGLRERERLRDMFGKYMATQVVQDLLDQGEVSLAGELREVTVLISDIRGYTALTEQLGAAEVVALLNEYLAILVEVVIEQYGVIDKFMGDALLCWFGAPVPVDDHAERAVRAAEAMLERTARWNADRVAAGLPPVPTGIGIATGSVVVGNIGSPQRLEYTAIGDAVNLAARLCGKAGAGEILVTADTGRAGDHYEALDPMPVKGIAEPVSVRRRRVPVVA